MAVAELKSLGLSLYVQYTNYFQRIGAHVFTGLAHALGTLLYIFPLLTAFIPNTALDEHRMTSPEATVSQAYTLFQSLSKYRSLASFAPSSFYFPPRADGTGLSKHRTMSQLLQLPVESLDLLLEHHDTFSRAFHCPSDTPPLPSEEMDSNRLSNRACPHDTEPDRSEKFDIHPCSSDTKASSVASSRASSACADSNDTAGYGDQEPFITFQHKVIKLCTLIFGHGRVSLEYMMGGGFNRVVGINAMHAAPSTFTHSWLGSIFPSILGGVISWLRSLFPFKVLEPTTQTLPERYILRIPRYLEKVTDDDISVDVATHRFARRILGDLVPSVVAFDATAENPIGDRYMLQTRLDGDTLVSVYDGLNEAQKTSAVRGFMDIMSKLQLVTADRAGVITDQHTLSIQKFRVGSTHAEASGTYPKSWTYPSRPQTTFSFLLDQCDRWIEFQQYCNPGGHVFPTWPKLRYITVQLYELGFLPDSDQFYFCHQDLFARNVLIKVVDESSVRITGVLDWDAEFAGFCPKFVAFQAPYDLWVDDENGEWDETRAMTDSMDGDPHNSALRENFLQCANDEWKRYATTPEYMIARRIFNIFKHGAPSNELVREMEAIVTAWQEIHYYKPLDRQYMSDDDSESDDSDYDTSRDSADNADGGEENEHGSEKHETTATTDASPNDGSKRADSPAEFNNRVE